VSLIFFPLGIPSLVALGLAGWSLYRNRAGRLPVLALVGLGLSVLSGALFGAMMLR
jgi:hypothetical protein